MGPPSQSPSLVIVDLTHSQPLLGRGRQGVLCQAAGCGEAYFLRTPRGAILLPVMADGAWREIVLFMLVHFAAAKSEVARLLSGSR